MRHLNERAVKPSFAFIVVMILLIGAIPLSAQETTHTVRPGENLYRIAQDYGVSVSAIAEANDIAYTWRIYAGQSLVIPGADSEANAPRVASNTTANSSGETTYHTVSYGESIGQIASRYGITLDALAELNDITNPNLIYAGQRLIVSGASNTANAEPSAANAAAPDSAPIIPGFSVVLPPEPQAAVPEAADATEIRHTVTYGESLSGIANRYGVSLLAITQANNIYDVNLISVGQDLIIRAGQDSAASDANASAFGILNVGAAPPPQLTIGREIIVDLSDQRIYAYENGVLVRNVLVSTGLPATPTVRGSFTIQRQYAAQTMSGPGYYLPDVPYVSYFYAGYALHGTYWHNNFGQPMSHGCVNLPTPEAEWFYNWTDIGTSIHVQA